jgi:predicted DNA-binding protein
MADGKPIRYSIFLPPDMHEALRRVAFEQHTDMAVIIRQLIEQYLAKK